MARKSECKGGVTTVITGMVVVSVVVFVGHVVRINVPLV
jgi:hypothetical protein